jgi:hypothetical protein
LLNVQHLFRRGFARSCSASSVPQAEQGSPIFTFSWEIEGDEMITVEGNATVLDLELAVTT